MESKKDDLGVEPKRQDGDHDLVMSDTSSGGNEHAKLGLPARLRGQLSDSDAVYARSAWCADFTPRSPCGPREPWVPRPCPNCGARPPTVTGRSIGASAWAGFGDPPRRPYVLLVGAARVAAARAQLQPHARPLPDLHLLVTPAPTRPGTASARHRRQWGLRGRG